MNRGWAGPVWGQPSTASEMAVPLRGQAASANASYRADGGQSDEFVVLAASVAGVAHRLAGRRCEDAYAWAMPEPGRLALVVADGVSTAGRGGEGADLAVHAASEHLLRCRGWGKEECEAAVRKASDELRQAGGGWAAELSTTIVVALLTAAGANTEVELARVGDSTAFVLLGTEWRELFPDPAEDDLRGQVVEVLPLRDSAGPHAIEYSAITLGSPGALVVVSDGVADPLRDGPGTVAPALAQVLSSGPEGRLAPLALAGATDFSRRGCQDDRTLVVAWPRPASASEQVVNLTANN
jgi:Protein phosphatase 2C